MQDLNSGHLTPSQNPWPGRIGAFIIRCLLKLRYRVKLRGLDQIQDSEGVLFLPNHPSHFDPFILTSHLWSRFKPRPMAIEYCYFLPIMNRVMKYVHALAVPNLDDGFSRAKIRRMERVLQDASMSLASGANLVIYPAGNLMRSQTDTIGGASGVHSILQQNPKAKIVLVRTRGLWGSLGSTAYTAGASPDPGIILRRCIKILLKNLIFFSPRRVVEIEFLPAPSDFPIAKDKMTFNQWLDQWYIAPGVEKLTQVSLSRWHTVYPKISSSLEPHFDLSAVPEEVQSRVRQELARMSKLPQEQITAQKHLSKDLGLDSLDRSDVLAWLGEVFDTTDLLITEIETVAAVMVAACRQAIPREIENEGQAAKGWFEKRRRRSPEPADGKTIQEAFLRRCDRMKGAIAMGDDSSGVLSWKNLKIATLAMSREIQKLPGDRIGIMLPASVGAATLCMATLLANKTPVMINWTLGPRNLEHVQSLTKVKVILTSMKFVDRLGETDLGSLESLLVFVEDLKNRIGLQDKLRAVLQARRRAGKLLRDLGLGQVTGRHEAVILFTSGSETEPKGVPLTHRNILTNLRDAFEVSDYQASDVILSFLPPFHSFGFVLTTILPMVSGIKIAYSPDPTDSAKLARAIPFWKATLVYGTPTFLSGILGVATEEQLATIRGMGGGAERFPESLFEKVKALTAGAYVVEGYGITECGPILTINRLGQPRQGVGLPFPSVELLIVDPETYAPLDQGSTGLILAYGENIFSGYLGKDAPDPFLEIEGKRYYITGDLGFLNDNGALVLSGRKKRFVKIAGEMISLPALEAALVLRWPQDENGPVVALESMDREGERPIICLFSTLDISLEEANAVLKKCGFSNLGKLTHLQKIHKVPVLGTGKTDYRSLKSLVSKVLD